MAATWYGGPRQVTGNIVNKCNKTVAQNFEMTHFLSKLFDMILAFDINGLAREYDLEAGGIIL